MEEKKCNVERLTLKPHQLKKGFDLKEEDVEVLEKTKNFIKKYGQLKPIIIRNKGQYDYEVIDGNKYLQALKELNMDAWCINLGDINDYDAMIIHLSINELNYKKNNIKFAELLSKFIFNKHDANRLSHKIPIDPTDIHRYKDLLDVNWKDQLKKAIESEKNMNQNTLF